MHSKRYGKVARSYYIRLPVALALVGELINLPRYCQLYRFR